MESLKMYVEDHIDTLVSEVNMLESKSEDEILSYIGSMLVANGYTVSGSAEGSIIVPAETFDLRRSFEVFSPAAKTRGMMTADTESMMAAEPEEMTAAATEGMSFGKRLEYAVCTDATLFKFFGDKENSPVEEVIKEGLPLVGAVLGVGSVLGGFWLGVAAAALALLLRLGYKTYCADFWVKNGKPQDAASGEEAPA